MGFDWWYNLLSDRDEFFFLIELLFDFSGMNVLIRIIGIIITLCKKIPMIGEKLHLLPPHP